MKNEGLEYSLMMLEYGRYGWWIWALDFHHSCKIVLGQNWQKIHNDFLLWFGRPCFARLPFFNRISIISFPDVQHIMSVSNLCSSILGNQSSFVLKRLCTGTDVKENIVSCLSEDPVWKIKLAIIIIIYISIVNFHLFFL